MIDRHTSDKANYLPYRKRHYNMHPCSAQSIPEHLESKAATPNGQNMPSPAATLSTKEDQDTANIMASLITTTTQTTINETPSSTPTKITHVEKPQPPPPVQTPAPIPTVKKTEANSKPPLKKPNGVGRPPARPQKKKIEDEEEDATDSSDDEEDDYNKIYCVCRQPYNPNLWMIACDICNEWYHGKCVQITATQARKIKVYVCQGCSKTTGQSTQFKSTKKRRIEENGGSRSESSSPNTSPLNHAHDEASDNSVSSPVSAIVTGITSPHSHDEAERPMKRKKVITDGDEKPIQEEVIKKDVIQYKPSTPSNGSFSRMNDRMDAISSTSSELKPEASPLSFPKKTGFYKRQISTDNASNWQQPQASQQNV
ncbi:lysine-specific demethylase [Acrasis kona]|uniref:Lysine-specific demethylase n=1 Tax=Acrasis kona TaxID=1008807 RepID=A0AAW2Z4N3_9EUKA